MDVNTSLNLLNAQNAASQPVTPVTASANEATNTGLIGNQPIPQDILSLTGSRPASQVNTSDLNAIMEQHNRQVQSFREMIERLLNQQSNAANIVINGETMIQIDEATRAQAQADIAEDGYFGVAQTSERILSFARAFAGEDEGRIEIMRNAFLAGFAAAEAAWGGQLPEISQQTFNAVMAGFDEMLGIIQPSE